MDLKEPGLKPKTQHDPFVFRLTEKKVLISNVCTASIDVLITTITLTC